MGTLYFSRSVVCWILSWTLILFPIHGFAQDIQLRVNLALSDLPTSVVMVETACELSNADETARGTGYVVLQGNTYIGAVNVPLVTNQALGYYDNVDCTLRLCSSDEVTSCQQPVASSSIKSPEKPFNTYADAGFHRLNTSQALADSAFLLHTPPPSYQMAANDQSANQSQTKSSSTGKSGGKSGGTSMNTFGDTVGAANDVGAAVETGVALADVVSHANFSSVTGLVVGLVGLAGSKILGASDNEVAQILGDLVGVGFTVVGVVASGSATLGALPAIALGTGTASLTHKLDKALDGSGKKGNTAVLTALEYYFPYDEDPEVDRAFRDAVNRHNAREAQQNSGSGGSAGSGSRSGSTNQNVGGGSSVVGEGRTEMMAGQVQFGQSGSGSGGSSSGSGGGSGSGAGANANNDASASGGGAAPAGGTGSGAGSGTGTAQTGQLGAGGAPAEADRNTRSGKTGVAVIVESRQNADGSYTYTAMVYEDTADGGRRYVDTIETTCVGGNCTSVGIDGKEEKHKDNNTGGIPIVGAIIELLFGSGDSDSAESAPASGSGSGSDSGSDNSGGDSPSGGSDTAPEEEGGSEDDNNCANEGGDCTNTDEAPAEEEEAETPETETSGDSTPNPDDLKGDSGAGIAWAMQNPNNPLAQQILRYTARAILSNSPYCQAGCPDLTGQGGLLWAMLNPNNLLAQSILANAAQAIADNSGSGQAGGTDNNPNNTGSGEASAEDIRRIELIIAGGGLVDPPEAPGVSGGGTVTGGGPVLGGGNPVHSGGIESNAPTTVRNSPALGTGNTNSGSTVKQQGVRSGAIQ